MPNTAHGTLVANQIKTEVLTPGRVGITIVNRDQIGVIWVRIDGQNPVPEGDDTYAVLGVRDFTIPRSFYQNAEVTVKMLSDGPRKYSIEAI